MRRIIHAACGCHTGKIRKNNEDNFCFDGVCLEKDNDGLSDSLHFRKKLKSGYGVAIFDGMGGENFGELASYTAASWMLQEKRSVADWFVSEKKYLKQVVQRLNDAVILAQEEMHTQRMGTTMAGLYFFRKYACACNVGDSRIYRLRKGELVQLSVDHVERRPGSMSKKAPLTQYLGFGCEDMELEPHIVREKMKAGDLYLLCSDGLTDMLEDFEISDIMQKTESVEACVQTLICAALDHGGRDNITAIVCKV